MGAAAERLGIAFGYLHVVSNNLSCRYDEDLSNERLDRVLASRDQLLTTVRDVISLDLCRDKGAVSAS